MIVLFLLSLIALGFGVCPVDQSAALEISSKTLKEKGKVYRRADVLIFLPIEKKLIEKRVELLKVDARIYKIDESVYEVRVTFKNRGGKVIENAVLEQVLGNSSFESETIYGKRLISRTPLIFEPLSLYVTDLSRSKARISLPPVGPGEEIELVYRIRGKKPQKPSLVGNYTLVKEEEDRVYMLVAKYSLLFGYGRTRTEDINLENIKELLEGFRKAGLKPVVKVVGLADGVTKNLRKNEEVAKERARFVARRVLGENFACYIRRGFAENFKQALP